MAPLNYPEQDRSTLIATRLGDHDVTVTHLLVVEEISQLFQIQIEFLSSDHQLSARDLIHQPAVVGIRSRVNRDETQERFFHGLVHRFSYRGEVSVPGQPDHRLSRYRAHLVPWLWLLTRTTNCRIFQQRTVPQIIETVLREYGGEFDLRGIRGQYPEREYCVQYRESDFAFVSRLLEEEGIFYYFRHAEDKHELILADQAAAYYECADGAMHFDELGTAATTNHIYDWEHDYEFRSGKYVHADFNFQTPTLSLRAEERSVLNLPGAADRTLYDYPGGFETNEEGRRYARLRIEEEESWHDVVRGTGVCPSFSPGGTFRLADHPNPAESRQSYLLTAAEHVASVPILSQGESEAPAYETRFRCIPAKQIFRPARQTPRPIVHGAQTAIVTGPEGELVYPDKYGRVKVQFHWDRAGQSNENSSCWIRVSQDWAGKRYGSVYLPHVGQEVIISFLEGDPDQPVITGRLYNAENMPPEELPDHKHRAIVAKDEVGNLIALDSQARRVDIQHAGDKFEMTVGTHVVAMASPLSRSATAGVAAAGAGAADAGGNGADSGDGEDGDEEEEDGPVSIDPGSMTVEIGLGCGFSVFVGATASANLAAAFDLSVGFSSSITFGGSYDASYGSSFSYAKGNFVNAGDSVGQVAFRKDAQFVSHKSVALAAGSGPENSVLVASSDSLLLSYGKTSPTFAGSPALAKWGGVVAAGILGTAACGLAGATAFFGNQAKEKGEFDDNAKKATATGTLGLASSIASALLLWAYAKYWSQVDQPVHGGALPVYSRLRLQKNYAKLWSAGSVHLHAEKEVIAIGDTFTVDAPSAVMSGDLEVKGKFNSANILDIGQPAARVAAEAKQLAEEAKEIALQSTEFARDTARQLEVVAKSLQK